MEESLFNGEEFEEETDIGELVSCLGVLLRAVAASGIPCVVLKESNLIFKHNCKKKEQTEFCQDCLDSALLWEVNFKFEFGTEH